MNNSEVYLKPTLFMEPLVNSWYAWPHLIPPVTEAMIIANSQVKIMDSFVRAPQVHAAAVKNPAMIGGPFLNFDGKRVREIKELLETTLREQAAKLQLAGAVRSLNEMLLNEGKGASLEGFYERIPPLLRGFVELVYDLNHRPTFRLIEGLIYRSPLYNTSSQSIALSLLGSAGRPFVFSTPRVPDEKSLRLPLAFKDPAIDELFKMRRAPKSFDEIKERLGLAARDEELFRSFLTEEKPAAAPLASPEAGAVRVRYLGHASLLIESSELSIMTDPVIGYEAPAEGNYCSYADLPEQIDYVLITHTHADHLVFETLLQLRHKIRNIIVPKNSGGFLEDPSLKLILKNTGFQNVYEIDELEAIEIAGGTITGVPFFGEHADLNVRCKTGYLINLEKRTILCLADSRNLDGHFYDKLHDAVGDVETLFVGMECEGAPLSWIYGSLLLKPIERKMDQSRRLAASNAERALEIVRGLHCRNVYIYAMGQEPWLSFLTSIQYTEQSIPIVEANHLVEGCRAQGIAAQRLLGLQDISL